MKGDPPLSDCDTYNVQHAPFEIPRSAPQSEVGCTEITTNKLLKHPLRQTSPVWKKTISGHSEVRQDVIKGLPDFTPKIVSRQSVRKVKSRSVVDTNRFDFAGRLYWSAVSTETGLRNNTGLLGLGVSSSTGGRLIVVMVTSSTKHFAVVTGASSGIGFELAKQFAQNGFDLLIVSEGEGINTAARELEGLGATVRAVRANLATHEGVHQLLAEIESAGRPLDAAAINAGVGVSGRFVETDLHAELNMVALNVTSTLHVAKYVVKQMVARGSGRILFTASIAATMPTPYETVYGATKAFVRSLSQGLREELKDTGITVTALMPGATETNFFHRAGADDTKLGAGEKDDAAEVAKEGFEALMAGKDHVVSGSLKNKLEAAAGYVLPDPLVAKAHAGQSEPGSASKK